MLPHGQSEIGFGITRLLDIDLLPRIKRISTVRMYRPEPAGTPDRFAPLAPTLHRQIRWNLIEENYDQVVKYATAIRNGTASTEAVLSRFTGAASHPGGQQRQRMADERHDDLEDQEPGDQPQRDRDVTAVGTGGDTVAVLVPRAVMLVLVRPRLRVISVAVRHASPRSGWIACVCCVWVSARSRSIRTWASSRR